MRCNSAELTGRFQPESSVLFVSCSAGIEPSLIQQVSVACGAYCAFFSNLRGQFVAGVLEGKTFPVLQPFPTLRSHPLRCASYLSAVFLFAGRVLEVFLRAHPQLLAVATFAVHAGSIYARRASPPTVLPTADNLHAPDSCEHG
jgi:hypothetical protein